MGIHLGLYYLPSRISSEAWADTYDLSLELLRAWPGGLLCLQYRKLWGHTVFSYSREIESGEGEDRRWKTERDATTLRTGETFALTRAKPRGCHRPGLGAPLRQ